VEAEVLKGSPRRICLEARENGSDGINCKRGWIIFREVFFDRAKPSGLMAALLISACVNTIRT
jgi:hypothetical protein